MKNSPHIGATREPESKDDAAIGSDPADLRPSGPARTASLRRLDMVTLPSNFLSSSGLGSIFSNTSTSTHKVLRQLQERKAKVEKELHQLQLDLNRQKEPTKSETAPIIRTDGDQPDELAREEEGRPPSLPAAVADAVFMREGVDSIARYS